MEYNKRLDEILLEKVHVFYFIFNKRLFNQFPIKR